MKEETLHYAKFDVLQHDRYAATLKMPVKYYREGSPFVTETMMRRFAKEKMPTLNYQQFTVHCTKIYSA